MNSMTPTTQVPVWKSALIAYHRRILSVIFDSPLSDSVEVRGRAMSDKKVGEQQVIAELVYEHIYACTEQYKTLGEALRRIQGLFDRP